MATTTLICRLCKTKAIPTGCLSLFTNSAVSQNLAGRISELLDVCVRGYSRILLGYRAKQTHPVHYTDVELLPFALA